MSLSDLFIGIGLGIVLGGFIRTDNDQTSYRNTNEYRIETKTEVVNSDTTQYIRIVRK